MITTLQFTNHTINSTTQNISENKFLTVDQNGKVILATNNNTEKIITLENEVAELKKQLNDLLLNFNVTKINIYEKITPTLFNYQL